MRMPVVAMVGAAFRFEGPLGKRHGKAQATDHVIQHVIVQIARPACADLQGHMPIAEVITGPREQNGFVEVDMESHPHVDPTLRIVTEMHERYGSVRAVIQAYLYRSEADAAALARLGVPVRLCKGAYLEPATVAFPRKSQVNENYKRLAEILLKKGVYPAIATHDPDMVNHALAFAASRGIPKDGFEFQMLYGIRRDLQERLMAEGYRLRLYVPYGSAWYPYFMRRLAERPANLLFLARNLFRR